jgi:hypothetical protein
MPLGGELEVEEERHTTVLTAANVPMHKLDAKSQPYSLLSSKPQVVCKDIDG